jgi:hypothetical protein
MAASKVNSVIKIVATPFTAVWGAVHAHAVKRVASTDGDLGERINTHKGQGTDLASTTTKSFVETQLRLFPYRTERLADEVSTLTANNGEYLKNYWKTAGAKEYFLSARLAVRLVALFMLGKMMTRQSVLPLIAPDSPLVPGIYEYHNPNKLSW